MANQMPGWKRATLILVFMILYVVWVAFYLIVLRPPVMLWCYQHFGMTTFPGLFHLILILSPWIVYGVIMGVIRNVAGTIKGRPYSD